MAEAKESLEFMVQRADAGYDVNQRRALLRLGRLDEAQMALEQRKDTEGHRYFDMFVDALTYAYLGEKEKAVEHLKSAFDLGFFSFPLLFKLDYVAPLRQIEECEAMIRQAEADYLARIEQFVAEEEARHPLVEDSRGTAWPVDVGTHVTVQGR